MKGFSKMIRAVIFAMILCLGGVAHAGAQNPAQGQSGFFSQFDDVPLMVGLVELPDQSLMFDQPQGRIVEAVAVGAGLEASEIYEFYDQTLPQLGWRKEQGPGGAYIYVRAGEKMSLHAVREGAQTTLKILLEPR